MKKKLAPEMVDTIAGMPLVDHASVDLTAARRTAYLLHQSFRYEYPSPITDLHHRLIVVPPDRHGDQRLVVHRLEVQGGVGVDVRNTVDGFGNHVVEIGAREVDEAVTFELWAVLERRTGAGSGGRPAVDASWLTDTRTVGPSRLTDADDAIRTAAADLRGTTGPKPLDIAEAVCHWAHEAIAYDYGQTSVSTTAADALSLGVGVCQDHAHLMLAVLRQLGIAGRYVSGHLLGEGATHAWVDVLVADPRRPGRAVAHAFDPCNDRRAGLGYLTVAVGRDYDDVAPTSGWYTGPGGGLLVPGKRLGITEVELRS